MVFPIQKLLDGRVLLSNWDVNTQTGDSSISADSLWDIAPSPNNVPQSNISSFLNNGSVDTSGTTTDLNNGSVDTSGTTTEPSNTPQQNSILGTIGNFAKSAIDGAANFNIPNALSNLSGNISNISHPIGTEDNIKSFMQQALMQWYDGQAVLQATKQLDSDGKFAGGELKNAILWWPIGVIGDIFKSGSMAAQTVAGAIGLSGAAGTHAAQWDYTTAIADELWGGMNLGLGYLQAEGGSTLWWVLANAAFASNPVQWAFNSVNNFIDPIEQSAQTALWFNPDSEASQVVRNIGTTALEAWALKWAGAIADNVTPAIVHPIDTYNNLVSWLSEDQRSSLQSNPYQAKDYQDMVSNMYDSNGNIDPEFDLKDFQNGKIAQEIPDLQENLNENKPEVQQAYSDINSSNIRLNTEGVTDDFVSPLKSIGIDINNDGTFSNNGSAEWLATTPSDINTLQNIYSAIKNSENNSPDGNISTEQFRNIRSALGNFAFNEGVSTNGTKIAKNLYNSMNERLRPQIPWMEELDSQFVDKLRNYKDNIDGIARKSGDNKWNLKENILNILKKSTGSDKEQLLAKLEEISPWIGDRIKSIQNLSPLYKSIVKGTGLRNRVVDAVTTVWAWAAASALWPMPAIAIALATHFGEWLVDGKLTKMKINAIGSVLSNMNEEWIAKLNDIQERVAKWKKLSEEQNKFYDSIKNMVHVQQKMLPAPTWEPLSAKVSNVDPMTGFSRNPNEDITSNTKMGTTYSTPNQPILPKLPQLPAPWQWSKINQYGLDKFGANKYVDDVKSAVATHQPEVTPRSIIRKPTTPISDKSLMLPWAGKSSYSNMSLNEIASLPYAERLRIAEALRYPNG